MDKNVEILLQAEAEVNKKVQAALQNKNDQLKSIKREADLHLASYKQKKEQEYALALNAVS